MLASYAYDNLARRTTLYRGNATQTDYAYDPVSRLATLTNNLGATAHDVTTTFAYNPASQIASSTRNNDAYAYLSFANKDAAEIPNGLNQLVSQASTTLSYDGRGNLTNSGTNAYTYTSENMLATQSGVPALAYEALGRLSQSLTGSGTATEFDYVGSAIVAEKNTSAGPILRRYVYGPGTDEPLVWYEGSGTTDRRWLYQDERGSVTAMANASGSATALNSYDDYGTPAAANVGRFGYTGQAWLPELGMSYYKARIYNPSIGRFMQTDPIGYNDGMNLYAYVSGDPVNNFDPDGLGTSCVTAYTESGKAYPSTCGEFGNGGTGGSRRPSADKAPGSGNGAKRPVFVRPEDEPQKQRSLLADVGSCIANQYGFGDDDGGEDLAAGIGRGISEFLATPVPKVAAGFYRHPGSSRVTNVLNALSVKTRIGSRVFFTGNAARLSNFLLRSARVATVLGRANVITGAAFAIYDAASIGYCTYKKGQN